MNHRLFYLFIYLNIQKNGEGTGGLSPPSPYVDPPLCPTSIGGLEDPTSIRGLDDYQYTPRWVRVNSVEALTGTDLLLHFHSLFM